MQTSDIFKPKDEKFLKEMIRANPHPINILHNAIVDNQIYLVSLIIEVHKNIINKMYFEGTPLMWAIFKGRYEICKIFLDHGADINIKNTYGHTAIYFVKQKRESDDNSLKNNILCLLRKHESKNIK